ncbi:hypothetical protein [Halomonas dongshanensis]|nr:hypothetical protein [Halomonas dongshanensis]
MAMTLMLGMFVLFLGFSGVGIYMACKTTVEVVDEHEDLPRDL